MTKGSVVVVDVHSLIERSVEFSLIFDVEDHVVVDVLGGDGWGTGKVTLDVEFATVIVGDVPGEV